MTLPPSPSPVQEMSVISHPAGRLASVILCTPVGTTGQEIEAGFVWAVVVRLNDPGIGFGVDTGDGAGVNVSVKPNGPPTPPTVCLRIVKPPSEIIAPACIWLSRWPIDEPSTWSRATWY